MTDQNDVSDLGTMLNNNGHIVTYADVRQAMSDTTYHMTMVGDEADYVMDAVNQGIDSRLEACFCPSRGDSYRVYRWNNFYHLACTVSSESMPILIRRLFEADNKKNNEGGPGRLANDLLRSLGIDEYGKLVGREALGLD